MKQLTPDEIKKIEDEIWREDFISPSNKFYFINHRKGYSKEAYLLNNYYINFTKSNDIWWMGLINLKPDEKSDLKGLLNAFKGFIIKYKFVGIWRHKDNLKLKPLHERACRMFNGFKGVEGECVYMVFNGGD